MGGAEGRKMPGEYWERIVTVISRVQSLKQQRK